MKVSLRSKDKHGVHVTAQLAKEEKIIIHCTNSHRMVV